MLARLHQYRSLMFSCCVVLHKSCSCNFDSCESLTTWPVLILLVRLLYFGYFTWDFPSSKELICCLYNAKLLCYQLLQFMVINYNGV